MAAFSRMWNFDKVCVTKAEYEEYGGERVRKWWGGNWNGELPRPEPPKVPNFDDLWES